MAEENAPQVAHFIHHRINDDLQAGKNGGRVVLRFPPEPNGYLHVGHAKAICLNFGLAAHYKGGRCHLRFDDSNPVSEKDEYVDAIEQDIRWLGYAWDALHYASDYFVALHDLAVQLIKDGKAYVCELNAEAVRAYRGTLTEAGKNSPYRDRPIEESLALFEAMRQGEMQEGRATLRAKIDMASGNMNLRDPAIYRIRHVPHHRTGDEWSIYPLYDFAHSLSDALEGITHSLCSLEFQDHRPLYDWYVEHTRQANQPQQIEFSRLNLTHTITSKRKLKALVEHQLVSGWDDPRMPTLIGLRRRGVPPEAIRAFCEQLGVSKQDSVLDISLLDEAVRNQLNVSAERRMAILHPLKVIITHYPEGESETLQLPNHPQHPDRGRRPVHWERVLYIERDDFQEVPEKGFKRLCLHGDVRLMNAYVIHCDEVIKDDAGEIIALHCHYAAETLGGKKPKDGRKVKGVVHWISETDAVDAEIRLYDYLFSDAHPASQDDFMASFNPDSLRTLPHAKVEQALAEVPPESRFQFNRVGYFVADRHDHREGHPVFNRIVSLRQVWKKTNNNEGIGHGPA